MDIRFRDARRTGRASLAAAGALALVVAACDLEPDTAPPTSLAGTGTVSGQIFFDANGNGLFDPVGGDTAITSATLVLSARGDSARVLQTGSAGAGGSFTFEDVPVGTHEVRGRVAGTGQPVTCTPVAVTVNVAETAFASTGLRLTCRVDISEAEQRNTGLIATVGGIVTAAPGNFRTTNPINLFIQDASGGLQIVRFPGGLTADVRRGDSIEVTGAMDVFNNEIQLGQSSAPVSLRVVTRDRPVTAREYTVADIRAQFTASGNRAKAIGELVVVRGVRVTGLPATVSGSGSDGRLLQGSSEIAIRLDQAANTQALRDRFADNTCYDLTGILGVFNSTIQLKPRDVNDVAVVTCPAS